MEKKFITNWFGKKSPGETLLEVIVALLVISMGAATATSLIITAIRANVFNKDSLIALNLAQEGLEYMRNLRDSNWLAYSANTQGCWNMATSTGTCVGPAYAGLIVEANSGGASNKGFSLGTSLSTAITPKLSLSDGISLPAEAGYLISYWDTNAADTEVDGNPNNDKDIMASSPVTGGTIGIATKYYRSIEVQYNTIAAAAPWGLTPTTDPKAADMMIVTSRVEWQDGSVVHRVSLSSALSRYK